MVKRITTAQQRREQDNQWEVIWELQRAVVQLTTDQKTILQMVEAQTRRLDYIAAQAPDVARVKAELGMLVCWKDALDETIKALNSGEMGRLAQLRRLILG